MAKQMTVAGENLSTMMKKWDSPVARIISADKMSLFFRDILSEQDSVPRLVIL
jgi:hypothetical protein